MSAELVHPRHPVLFSDQGCPFAHRVRSLLEHLGVPYGRREAPARQHPEGLGCWSPSGRIPLLVHGTLAIGESRVMLEYLSEVYAFEAAYAPGVAERTLQRQAMAVMDSVLVPELSIEQTSLAEARLGECLDVLESAMSRPPEPSLLAFHLAPIWLRFQWRRPQGRTTRSIRERPNLATWLDAAASLPSVSRTAENVACELGVK